MSANTSSAMTAAVRMTSMLIPTITTPALFTGPADPGPAVAVKMIGVDSGVEVMVSQCDATAVGTLRLRRRNGYVIADGHGKLTKFIMGDQPNNVPDNYLRTFVNRNKLDCTRGNIVWADPSFQAWNGPNKPDSASPFKGVSRDRSNPQRWRARSAGGKHLGAFDEEHSAGRAAVKAFIRQFGALVIHSDLLVGDGPGKFSQAEMQDIINEVNADIERERMAPKVPKLPRGITKVGDRYKASHTKAVIGIYDTVEDAVRAKEARIEEIRSTEWAEHLKKPITYDSNGDAVIKLNGKIAAGRSAKVDECLWHKLTSKVTWSVTGEYAIGRWEGKDQRMHVVVYTLHYPEYVNSRENQIDHIDATQKLDNRICNLREADIETQARNRVKREGLTSQYMNVWFNKRTGLYVGEVKVDGKKHYYNDKSEHEAARWVNAKNLEIFGDKAVMMEIKE